MGQRTNGPGVAQRTRAAAGGLDSSAFEVAANDHGDGDAVERTEWSFGAQKEFPTRDLPRAMLKVLDQSLAHRLHERQHHFLAALLRADTDAGVLPVQIIQKQLGRETPRMP